MWASLQGSGQALWEQEEALLKMQGSGGLLQSSRRVFPGLCNRDVSVCGLDSLGPSDSHLQDSRLLDSITEQEM